MTTAFVFLCLAVAFHDLLFRRVPNGLLLLALIVHAGFLIDTGHGLGGIDIAQSLLGGAISLALFIPLYALRAMGAGDVKFFALLGALLGPYYLIPLWLIGSVLAGIHATVLFASKKRMATMPPYADKAMKKITDNTLYQRMLRRRSGRKGIPYAAYLAVAAVVATTT